MDDELLGRAKHARDFLAWLYREIGEAHQSMGEHDPVEAMQGVLVLHAGFRDRLSQLCEAAEKAERSWLALDGAAHAQDPVKHVVSILELHDEKASWIGVERLSAADPDRLGKIPREAWEVAFATWRGLSRRKERGPRPRGSYDWRDVVFELLRQAPGVFGPKTDFESAKDTIAKAIDEQTFIPSTLYTGSGERL